jgi:hypothetical protein
MALTLCPRCKTPASLVDSRRIGLDLVPDHGWCEVVERRIACTCSPEGVIVVKRIDVVVGTSSKRVVARQTRGIAP